MASNIARSVQCPPPSQTQCVTQLSPSALPSNLAPSRCSNVSHSDQCTYSHLSCDLLPITTLGGTKNEIKIIITDPQNNSVISSVHDAHARTYPLPHRSIRFLSVSSLFTSMNTSLRRPWLPLMILFCAVLSPALLGLIIGLTIGWIHLPVLKIGIVLFFASGGIIFVFLVSTSAWRLSGNIRRRSHQQSLQGDNIAACYGSCLSLHAQMEQENCMINCAEKKISRTEFFTVDY
eukprot:GFUD01041962.1.p1 GENE.GFUD01041962.1~~GFUD01041962.1.p1  ORF type:complete len:234 (-),score=19.08 GFUD01041962.1:171-872(-)